MVLKTIFPGCGVWASLMLFFYILKHIDHIIDIYGFLFAAFSFGKGKISMKYDLCDSRFYTYGSVPLEKHLEYIQKHALQKFSRINPGTEVPLEPKWGEPVGLCLIGDL